MSKDSGGGKSDHRSHGLDMSPSIEDEIVLGNQLIEEADEKEIERIASVVSQRQRSVVSETSLAGFGADPFLEVENGGFDLSKWLRKFLRTFHNETGTPKQTGVLCKSLNVYGSGSGLRIQQTVGSYLLAPLRCHEHVRFGKRLPRRILHNFDGVLQRSELLIVLGRPGSGCSTLLKTICGELTGLSIDKASTIHYSGITQKRMVKEFKGEVVYNQEVCHSLSAKKLSVVHAH